MLLLIIVISIKRLIAINIILSCNFTILQNKIIIETIKFKKEIEKAIKNNAIKTNNNLNNIKIEIIKAKKIVNNNNKINVKKKTSISIKINNISLQI